MEPAVETTLMGWKAWTVVGIIIFAGGLYLTGVYNAEARTYIDGAAKTMLNLVTALK